MQGESLKKNLSESARDWNEMPEKRLSKAKVLHKWSHSLCYNNKDNNVYGTAIIAVLFNFIS